MILLNSNSNSDLLAAAEDVQLYCSYIAVILQLYQRCQSMSNRGVFQLSTTFSSVILFSSYPKNCPRWNNFLFAAHPWMQQPLFSIWAMLIRLQACWLSPINNIWLHVRDANISTISKFMKWYIHFHKTPVLALKVTSKWLAWLQQLDDQGLYFTWWYNLRRLYTGFRVAAPMS